MSCAIRSRRKIIAPLGKGLSENPFLRRFFSLELSDQVLGFCYGMFRIMPLESDRGNRTRHGLPERLPRSLDLLSGETHHKGFEPITRSSIELSNRRTRI